MVSFIPTSRQHGQGSPHIMVGLRQHDMVRYELVATDALPSAARMALGAISPHGESLVMRPFGVACCPSKKASCNFSCFGCVGDYTSNLVVANIVPFSRFGLVKGSAEA